MNRRGLSKSENKIRKVMYRFFIRTWNKKTLVMLTKAILQSSHNELCTYYKIKRMQLLFQCMWMVFSFVPITKERERR
jgi:hypothetical protein